MKILLYGINFYPELTGIGKYSGELAAYLVENGHKVKVISAPPYYPEWRLHKGYSKWLYKKEIWSGTTIIRCPIWVPTKKNAIQRILHLLTFSLSSLPVALWQVFWKPDMVLSIAPALTTAPIAHLIANLSGSIAWLHVQDLELDAALGLEMIPSNSVFEKTIRAIEKRVIAGFDHISTISKAMRNKIIDKGIPPEKISVLPNWVDTNLIKPLPSAHIKLNFGFSDDSFIILHAGNMGKKQGLEIIIETAKLLTDHKNIFFVLSGDGADRPRLESLARGMSNIRFLPLQPLNHLNELLNMADLHVLPQKKDAADLVMPSKLSGMLASGKPVIALTKSDTEIASIVSQTGQVVTPENPSALAKVIMDLYNDSSLRKSMALKGRIWVEKNWSKEKVLSGFNDELIKVQTEIPGQHKSKG